MHAKNVLLAMRSTYPDSIFKLTADSNSVRRALSLYHIRGVSVSHKGGLQDPGGGRELSPTRSVIRTRAYQQVNNPVLVLLLHSTQLTLLLGIDEHRGGSGMYRCKLQWMSNAGGMSVSKCSRQEPV